MVDDGVERAEVLVEILHRRQSYSGSIERRSFCQCVVNALRTLNVEYSQRVARSTPAKRKNNSSVDGTNALRKLNTASGWQGQLRTNIKGARP